MESKVLILSTPKELAPFPGPSQGLSLPRITARKENFLLKLNPGSVDPRPELKLGCEFLPPALSLVLPQKYAARGIIICI